jgi:hypothetical protein
VLSLYIFAGGQYETAKEAAERQSDEDMHHESRIDLGWAVKDEKPTNIDIDVRKSESSIAHDHTKCQPGQDTLAAKQNENASVTATTGISATAASTFNARAYHTTSLYGVAKKGDMCGPVHWSDPPTRIPDPHVDMQNIHPLGCDKPTDQHPHPDVAPTADRRYHHRVTDLMRFDHMKIAQMYDQYQHAKAEVNKISPRQVLAYDIRRAIQRHLDVEEDVIYKRIANGEIRYMDVDAPGTTKRIKRKTDAEIKAMYDELKCQHDEIRDMLKNVDVDYIHTTDHDTRFRMGVDMMINHIKEEEATLIKFLMDACDNDKLRQLGSEYELKMELQRMENLYDYGEIDGWVVEEPDDNAKYQGRSRYEKHYHSEPRVHL